MIYDLVIVGGGMSGISVGHFFRDWRILILERGAVAGEATGKNAGFIISGFGEHFRKTAQRWGVDRACEIQRIHLSNHGRIRALAGNADCGYKKTGSLAVALDEAEREELLASSRLMRDAGF
ncbi:MAG TPA: FAD-dependent oxidoreductase, partial [Acidobacteriota bacterium]|nr:FAD-dependent oxidoreductase [Acidobacteriota bacterium]